MRKQAVRHAFADFCLIFFRGQFRLEFEAECGKDKERRAIFQRETGGLLLVQLQRVKQHLVADGLLIMLKRNAAPYVDVFPQGKLNLWPEFIDSHRRASSFQLCVPRFYGRFVPAEAVHNFQCNHVAEKIELLLKQR